MRRATVLGIFALLVGAAPALAVNYPGPHKPGKVKRHTRHRGGTLRVCKHGKHRYRTISRAVAVAKRGATIRVCHGVYHEGVLIQGKRKSRLKLIGDVRHPSKVVIDSRGVKAPRNQNAIQIYRANHVTVEGFYTRHYKANGVFALSVRGYKLTHLLAGYGGVYGIYAFNSYGGTMTHSEAFYNNDSGFYIGQTPRQVHPIRSRVSHIKAWGNVLGWSGTNMRYVTITKSRFYNNGLGIVPNALRSEKLPPAEDNVITDNDIFWNNFNYFKGAPFKLKKGATGDELPYPVGTGVLVFGGRRNIISRNRIFGNWLGGAGLFEQVELIGDPKYDFAGHLVGNQIQRNDWGAGGADLNGRDEVYDGEGRDNCVDPTGTRSPNVPADGSTFKPCPYRGSNGPVDGDVLGQIVHWSADSLTLGHEAHWIRHPHKAIKGIRPLVECKIVRGSCQGQPRFPR